MANEDNDFERLFVAIETDDIGTVRHLLDSGLVTANETKTFEIDDKRFCVSALFDAVLLNRTLIAQELIRKGAKLEHANDLEKFTSTSLEAACLLGRHEVARILLENGADPKATGDCGSTPILRSVYANDMNTIRLLVQHGASLYDTRGSQHPGWSILHGAVMFERINLIEPLLEMDKTLIEKETSDTGATPLYYACLAGKISFVKELLKKRPDVEAGSTRFQVSCLTGAAIGGHVEIVRLLIDAGADLEAFSELDYETALYYAAGMENLDVVKELVEQGAEINKRSYWPSPVLSRAARRSQSQNITYLLSQGARYADNIFEEAGSKSNQIDADGDPLGVTFELFKHRVGLFGVKKWGMLDQQPPTLCHEEGAEESRG